MNPNYYWLAAIHLSNVLPSQFLTWLTHFPSIETLFQSTSESLTAAGVPEKHHPAIQHPQHALIKKDIEWLKQSSTHDIIPYTDPRYPPLLKEIYDPPLLLFTQGNASLLTTMQIAMIGARKATTTAIQQAEDFAFALSEAGLTITSGLALGIDAASHRGALKAHGHTIAVMGTGLKHLYPKTNIGLARMILKQDGLILSEFPVDTSPFPHHFPRRNRIISGLSLGVLLVQAAIKSGSLITARLACEQGREVFAIPGPIHHPLSHGAHFLIRQGAMLVETPQDIIETLLPGYLDQKRINKDLALTPEQITLLETIDHEVTPLDMIVLRNGAKIGDISTTLLTLELKGYIEAIHGGYRIKSIAG